MGRFLTGAACAALIVPLAACGGGGGDSSSTPPVTLKGVSYERFVALPGLNQTEGGDGPDVIYVDEGAMEFLGTQASSAGGTTEFRASDGSVALVTALPGFESTRLIRIAYAQTGMQTEGVIGRFTNERLMATANGSASYRGGPGTAEVRVVGSQATPSFDLTGGSTIVDVNFGAGSVKTTLDFRGTASASNPDARVDLIVIDGMAISGNRFSGGRLDSFKGTSTTPDTAYSVGASNLQSSGVFAGWNDSTGNVAGGNRPAEVAGAFVADPGTSVMTGRYLAD